MKIAIVGGGIGGLAAAIFLSRAGHNITVYEQAKSAEPVGAGFLLQPPGQAVLKKLGVLEDVLQEAVPIYSLQSQTTSGKKILDLYYKDLVGTPRNGLGVQRSTIYEALLTAAKKLNAIKFNWNAKVQRCETESQCVSVITAYGAPLKYDYCVLSSGSNSDLANDHFRGRICRRYPWACLWTTIKLPPGFCSNTLHQRCMQSKKMMGILPVRHCGDGYEAALYWSISASELHSLNAKEFENIKNEMLNLWPEAAPSIRPLEYSNFIPATYNDVWTPKPYSGRLIALGDISHATSPQLGQGCTMALLDAWELSKKISDHNSLSDVMLNCWWRNRKYQLAYVRQLSKFLTPLFQSDNRLNAVFRDRVVAPLGRLPLFSRLQLKTLASEVFLK